MKNENNKTISMIVVATRMKLMKVTTPTTKNQKLLLKIQPSFMKKKKKKNLKTLNQLNLDSLGNKNSNIL
jgi:hypothetical protein